MCRVFRGVMMVGAAWQWHGVQSVKKVVSIVVIFALPVPLFGAHGATRIIRHEEARFENRNCEENDSCSLKNVRYVVEDYEVDVGVEVNYGTRFFAWYETDVIESLEDYVFVQFILGCVYKTSFVGGRVASELSLANLHFEEFRLAQYPQWAIDSIDTDPAYHSAQGHPRHFQYRWDPVLSHTRTEKIWGLQKPNSPTLYVRDYPSTAFFQDGHAQNVSLRFNMCLYKAGDVPEKWTPDKLDFAVPISCFSWDSSFIYNHARGVFERHGDIAEVCR